MVLLSKVLWESSANDRRRKQERRNTPTKKKKRKKWKKKTTKKKELQKRETKRTVKNILLTVFSFPPPPPLALSLARALFFLFLFIWFEFWIPLSSSLLHPSPLHIPLVSINNETLLEQLYPSVDETNNSKEVKMRRLPQLGSLFFFWCMQNCSSMNSINVKPEHIKNQTCWPLPPSQ